MRLAPPVRTTARNPVLDEVLSQRRAVDEACLQLAVDAMHDEMRAARATTTPATPTTPATEAR